MKQVALLDICYPDYFTGYSRPVVAIPVYGKMTNAEIADEIESELNSVWDYLFGEEANEADEKLYDEYLAKLRQNPNDIFLQVDEVGEDEESCMAYFSIINPVFVNGLTFLNS